MPLVSSCSILISWHLLVCEGCKGRKEGARERRYLLNFNFILFGFSHGYSIARNVFLDDLRIVISPKSSIEIYQCLQWLISPNSIRSCLVVSSRCLLHRVSLRVADTTHAAQSAEAVEYTDCFSAMNVLDMPLNNLKVRFQQCWNFGECRVSLYCHRSQVHSGPKL